MVTLGGQLGERMPTDDRSYLSFARSLPCSDLCDVIQRAVPVSDVACFTFGDSRRPHYERLARFPRSYVVLGDALCSFNPVYGQGMSVAALEALALRDCLTEPEGIHDLWQRLYPRLSRIVDGAWQLPVQGDMAYPEVAGRQRHHVRAAMQWYLGRVHSV